MNEDDVHERRDREKSRSDFDESKTDARFRVTMSHGSDGVHAIDEKTVAPAGRVRSSVIVETVPYNVRDTCAWERFGSNNGARDVRTSC